MSGKNGITYADAGVDIDAGNALVDRIKPAAQRTERPGTMSGLGGFGALFDLKGAGYSDPILVAASDGVGTKRRIAIDTGLVDGVGIDLVAMCVNDLVCQGAEPLVVLDYFATGKLSVDPAAREVSLSSIGHRLSPIHFEDIHYRERPYDKWEAYGQSKTANALFAVAFDERYAEHGINANAVMPGGIMTPLQRHLSQEEMAAMGWLDEDGKPVEGFKPPEQGASPSVWAAVGEELEGVGGLYLEDCAEAPPWTPEHPQRGVMDHAQEPEAAERLWIVSEETVGMSL